MFSASGFRGHVLVKTRGGQIESRVDADLSFPEGDRLNALTVRWKRPSKLRNDCISSDCISDSKVGKEALKVRVEMDEGDIYLYM